MTQPLPKQVPEELKSFFKDNLRIFDYFKRLTNGAYTLWDSYNNGLMVHAPSTVANLPAASDNEGRIMRVTDAVSGAPFVISNGTNWLEPDGSVVS